MLQQSNVSLFIYGSMCEGWVHYDKIRNYVVESCRATVEAATYRLPVGYPVLILNSNKSVKSVPGTLVRLRAPEILLRLLDEFHGYMPMTPEKSLFNRSTVNVTTEAGETVEAYLYAMNFAKLPKTANLIPDGDWHKDLSERPALTEGLTERQADYVKRLGKAKGREIVPIDLNLYRELMKLDLIVDKGRRLALTRLGKEAARYLDDGPIIS